MGKHLLRRMTVNVLLGAVAARRPCYKAIRRSHQVFTALTFHGWSSPARASYRFTPKEHVRDIST